MDGLYDHIQEDLAAGKPVFQDLVSSLLLANTHKVTLEMVPDTELEKAQVAAEEARLAEVKAAMSSEDIDRVIADTAKLKAVQAAHDTPEQLATIPTLTLEDLSTEQLELPNELSTTAEGVTVLRHEVPSNGILYADVGLDLTQLAASELPLVSLFSRCLLQCGTDKEDEVALLSAGFWMMICLVRATRRWHSDRRSGASACSRAVIFFFPHVAHVARRHRGRARRRLCR